MVVDVACSLTKNISISLLVMINSIVSNTRDPKRLRFNIVVPSGECDIFHNLIQKGFPNREFDLRIKDFVPPVFMSDYLQNRFRPKTEQAKQSRYMQYSRLFYKQIFPDIDKVICLDTDILVLGDLSNLYDAVEKFNSDQVFAAAPHLVPAFMYFSNPFLIRSEIPLLKTTFNSGVILTDLSLWQEEIYTRLRHYLQLDAEQDYRLYYLGDETILNLLFQNFIHLDPKWNRCGYGNSRLLTCWMLRPLHEIEIIHWSGGHHKPWRSPHIPYGELWRKYNRFDSLSV